VERIARIDKLAASRAQVKKISEVARGSNFGFEKRLLDGRGRHYVCWAYSMTIIVLPSGAVMVPP